MKLDIHTHILPENLPDLSSKYDGTKGWISIVKSDTNPDCACMMQDGKLFRKIEKNCWSLSERFNEMRKANVTSQVLSTVPVMFNYAAKAEHTNDLCHILNDDLRMQINKFQENSIKNDEILKSFYGFGTLPMQDPTLAVEEMTRCVKDLDFKGIQIGSHVNDWLLNDKNLYPIWKRAEDLQCPIFVHPWDMDHITKTNKYWLPWLVGMPAETANAICCLLMGGVLQRFPRLRFCFAHGGGAFPFTVGRIEHGYEVRPDLCAVDCQLSPKEFIGKFYTDSLVHSEDSLDLLIKVIGEKNIILGSDYPFPLGEHEAGTLIDSSSLSKDLKERLLYKNGMEFLGLI